MDKRILKIAYENIHSFSTEVNSIMPDYEKRIIPMTFAKEYPVAKWWGVLMLQFGKKNVLLNRWKQKQGVPFLNNHLTTDQRGIILNGYLNDGTLGGDVKFSRNQDGEDLMNDIADGIRPYTSVGFNIHKLHEMSEDEMTDEIKSLVLETKLPAYSIDLWEPLEGSSAWLGENPNVGAFSYEFYDMKNKDEVLRLAEELNLPLAGLQVQRELEFEKTNYSLTKIKENEMDPKEKENLDAETALQLNQEREEREKTRKNEITRLAADYKEKMKGINIEELRDLHIQGGLSVHEFSKVISDNIVQQVKEAASKPTVSLTQKEVETYSLGRAISSLMNGDNCLELEVSAEYAKQSGRRSGEGSGKGFSFFLPHQIAKYAQMRGSFDVERKITKFDVSTTAGSGGEFVPTEHMGGEWIDVLLNKIVLSSLGVVYLPGRKGNIEIPKLSAGNTFGWAATENAALSESTPTTTEITMSPKRGGTYVDVSKTAIIQSDPALDVILTQNGQNVMVRGFEAGALHGTGASGQFKGVANLDNVNNSALATVTWAKILDAIKRIKAANADLGEISFLTNSAGEVVLAGREKGSAGYPIFILGDDGRIARRRCLMTEAVNANYIFLGAWSQAYMAFWDALDVTVDALTLATTFQVRITFNQLADFAARYDQAFYYASDLS